MTSQNRMRIRLSALAFASLGFPVAGCQVVSMGSSKEPSQNPNVSPAPDDRSSPGSASPEGPASPTTPIPGGSLGPDGVKQIYPDKVGATQFYLNMDDPYKDGGGAGTTNPNGQFNISYGTNSKFPFTAMTEGGLIFFNTTGSPITYNSGSPPGRSVRLDIYPDGGKFANRSQYSWQSNPGYLY